MENRNEEKVKELNLNQLEKVIGGADSDIQPEQLYVCQKCGAAFTSEHFLSDHINRDHGQGPHFPHI